MTSCGSVRLLSIHTNSAITISDKRTRMGATVLYLHSATLVYVDRRQVRVSFARCGHAALTITDSDACVLITGTVVSSISDVSHLRGYFWLSLQF